MAMWDSILVKNFIVPVLRLQIYLGNDVLNNLIDFIDYDVDTLYIGEEMAHITLVILNQVVAKIQQNRQIWDVNDGLMLRRKSIQLKRLQAMKESTPGLNDNIGITIALAEKKLKKKKKKGKIWQKRSPNY